MLKKTSYVEIGHSLVCGTKIHSIVCLKISEKHNCIVFSKNPRMWMLINVIV